MTALILYGSFYPWQFHARELGGNPLWVLPWTLLHSWPNTFDRFFYRDVVVNVTLYIPFGTFCFLSMSGPRARAMRAAATIAAAAALSATVEMTQIFEPMRVCSLLDVLTNTLGGAVGVAIATTFPQAISGVVKGAEAKGVFRMSGVLALLYVWAGYQLFPFFPALSLYALRGKLAALSGPGAWPARDLLESFGGWLAAAALVESLAGSGQAGWLTAAALLAVPLKLLIAHRTTTWSELAGAAAGAACWMALRKLKPAHRAAAVLALVALVAAGLTPFQWASRAQPFIWVPFLALLKSPWETAFLVLLEKSFLYGSAVWLMKESGRGWAASTLLVAAPLAAVEAAQIWLPGRTPEITDPLLAILLGLGLMLMERRAAASGDAITANAAADALRLRL